MCKLLNKTPFYKFNKFNFFNLKEMFVEKRKLQSLSYKKR